MAYTGVDHVLHSCSSQPSKLISDLTRYCLFHCNCTMLQVAAMALLLNVIGLLHLLAQQVLMLYMVKEERVALYRHSG